MFSLRKKKQESERLLAIVRKQASEFEKRIEIPLENEYELNSSKVIYQKLMEKFHPL